MVLAATVSNSTERTLSAFVHLVHKHLSTANYVLSWEAKATKTWVSSGGTVKWTDLAIDNTLLFRDHQENSADVIDKTAAQSREEQGKAEFHTRPCFTSCTSHSALRSRPAISVSAVAVRLPAPVNLTCPRESLSSGSSPTHKFLCPAFQKFLQESSP